ncbi:hypothetical protein, partial [Cupriavidus basilensis]|uniref:hypothetical protein n=1 Tax=Cupriavidus basilensis TaxID=68895 RepID=UPI001C2D152F
RFAYRVAAFAAAEKRDYKELSAFHQYFFNLFLLRLDSLRVLLTFPTGTAPRTPPPCPEAEPRVAGGANTRSFAQRWQVFSKIFSRRLYRREMKVIAEHLWGTRRLPGGLRPEINGADLRAKRIVCNNRMQSYGLTPAIQATARRIH